jgi:hypothetical protein
METLKPFNEVKEPDNRRVNSYFLDTRTGEARPLLLEDIYSLVEQIKFNNYVPEEVQSHFEMARNLFVYSWFHYPFNVAAQLYSFITIEFALKYKYTDGSPIILSEGYTPPKPVSFKTLLRRSVKEGLITDAGFLSLKLQNLKPLIEILLKMSKALNLSITVKR